ncbi:MAG: carboxypeptidase-like regulatory domain-containing protein [bacterium]
MKNIVKILNKINGISLIEIIISITIISVAFITVSSFFIGITKGVVSTKYKTLATTYAQEQIELLKSLDYEKLRITPQADLSYIPPSEPYKANFDRTYYPEETTIIKNMRFDRLTRVRNMKEQFQLGKAKLLQDRGGVFEKSLKEIKVTVFWMERDTIKSVTLVDLNEKLQRVYYGTIAGDISYTRETPPGGYPAEIGPPVNPDPYDDWTDYISPATYAASRIWLLDDNTYGAVPDSNGLYSFKCPVGTYPNGLKVTMPGYEDGSYKPVTVNKTLIIQYNFTLIKISSAAVEGTVHILDHVVISKVCASFNDDVTAEKTIDYIELYNPASTEVEIFSAAGKPQIILEYVDDKNIRTEIPLEQLGPEKSIAPHGYYSIANRKTLEGTMVDAKDIDQLDRIQEKKPGGIIVTFKGSGATDRVGWGNTGNGAPAPSDAVEGDPLELPVNDGLMIDETIERKADSSSAAVDLESGGADEFNGNGYDSNNNARDWVYHNRDTTLPHDTSTGIEDPIAGTPGLGCWVTCDDPFEHTIEVDDENGEFLLEVAVDAWTVTVSCNTLSDRVSVDSEIDMITSEEFFLTPDPSVSDINGYIRGTLLDSATTDPIPNILVTAENYSNVTDANGIFRLIVPPSIYTVTVNPDNINPHYIEETVENITVTEGNITPIPAVLLPEGGSVAGRVLYGDSFNPYQDMTVEIFDSADSSFSNPLGSDISDMDGKYTIKNLPITGSYRTKPLLASFETSTPDYSAIITISEPGVIQPNDDFNIGYSLTAGYAVITGTATYLKEPLSSGVLIIASTCPFVSPNGYPPNISGSHAARGSISHAATIRSDGTYSLAVYGSANNPYFIYAWYSTIDESNHKVIIKHHYIFPDEITMLPGDTVTYNLENWQ